MLGEVYRMEIQRELVINFEWYKESLDNISVEYDDLAEYSEDELVMILEGLCQFEDEVRMEQQKRISNE